MADFGEFEAVGTLTCHVISERSLDAVTHLNVCDGVSEKAVEASAVVIVGEPISGTGSSPA